MGIRFRERNTIAIQWGPCPPGAEDLEKERHNMNSGPLTL